MEEKKERKKGKEKEWRRREEEKEKDKKKRLERALFGWQQLGDVGILGLREPA